MQQNWFLEPKEELTAKDCLDLAHRITEKFGVTTSVGRYGEIMLVILKATKSEAHEIAQEFNCTTWPNSEMKLF